METSRCQDKSELKWPIAPDGYIPNSVIRGWIQVLKRAKWGPNKSSDDEDEGDEKFHIYDHDNKKTLRAVRRKKRDNKTIQFDYQPGQDWRPVILEEDLEEDQEEDLKEALKEALKVEMGFVQETGGGQDEENVHLSQFKRSKDGWKTDGFAHERQRPMDTLNRLNWEISSDKIFKNPKERYHESMAETKPVSKGDVGSGWGMEGQKERIKISTEEEVRKMLVNPMESNRGMEGQHEKGKISTEEELQKKSKISTEEELQKKSKISTEEELQKIVVSPMESENFEKIPSSERLNQKPENQQHTNTTSEMINIHTQASVFKRGPAGPVPDLKEIQDSTDDKPSSKYKLSEANKQKATRGKQDIAKIMSPSKPKVVLMETQTPKQNMVESESEKRNEFRNPLPSKLIKASKPNLKPQPVASAPKTMPKRDPTQARLDLKVLGLYKKFNTGKWVPPKPTNKQSSTNLYRSRQSFSVTEHVDPRTEKSLYQRGSGVEKAKVGSSRPLGQTGLWQVITNGVSESMDPDMLWELLQGRPTDGKNNSEMGGFAEMIDQGSDEMLSERFGAVRESMDKSTFGGKSMEKPSDFRIRSKDMVGHRYKDDNIQDRSTSISKDPNHFSTLDMEGLSASTNGSDTLKELSLQTDDRSSESMAGMGVANAETSIVQGGRGLGPKDSSRHSTILQTADLKDELNWSARVNRPGSIEPMSTGSTVDSPTGQRHDTRSRQLGHSRAQNTHGFDEFMDNNYDRRVEETVQSIPQRKVLEEEHLPPQHQINASPWLDQSKSYGAASLQGSRQTMAKPGYDSHAELTYPEFQRSGMRFNEFETSHDVENERRREDGPPMFSRRTEDQRPTYGSYGTVDRLGHSIGHSGAALNDTRTRSDEAGGFHAIALDGREGLDGHEKSLSRSGLVEGRIGASAKDKTTKSRESVHGYAQSTVGTMSGGKSQESIGLQTVKSMVHTPGFLTSSEPEKFLKALSQKRTKKAKTKPMETWRQGLYQLIFLYGFCSPQTTKLLEREKYEQEELRSPSQKGDIELYQFANRVAKSVLHERSVKRVAFQYDLQHGNPHFFSLIPLPSINNFITLEKYGATEYGKFLFEWQRGDEDDQEMHVTATQLSLDLEGNENKNV